MGSAEVFEARMVSGRHIFFNLHGEFWHGGQSNQFFDYLDNGLFAGQFGQPVGSGVPRAKARELRTARTGFSNSFPFVYSRTIRTGFCKL